MLTRSSNAHLASVDAKVGSRRGFTLLEGLVVVTLIAAMGGILRTTIDGLRNDLGSELTDQLILAVDVRVREAVAVYVQDHPELLTEVRDGITDPQIVGIIEQAIGQLNTIGELGTLPVVGILLPVFTEPVLPFVNESEFLSTTVPPNWRTDHIVSYQGARDQIRYYSANSGFTQACTALLNAAETAELRGNLTAKARQLNALLQLIRAQTGNALTGYQSGVVTTLVRML